MKKEIIMPRLGINDEYVSIGEWFVAKGSFVKKGQVIASLETTKETTNLLSEFDGYLYYEYEAGEEVQVGKPVAVISDQPHVQSDVHQKDITTTVKITQKARKLMDEYHIEKEQFSGLELIREKDVRLFIDGTREPECNHENRIIIVAGGGLAKMCIDLIRLTKLYQIFGVVDPNKKIGEKIMEVPVLGSDDVLESLQRQGYMMAVNAIGSISVDRTSAKFSLRKNIYKKIKSLGFYLPNLIHPSAQISPSAQLGEGCIIMENVVIGSEAVIGNNCIINTGAIVSHDCRIGHHARISPGAILAGGVQVGENSLVGMGVTIYLNLKIGENVIISNGKDIVGNIPDDSVIC